VTSSRGACKARDLSGRRHEGGLEFVLSQPTEETKPCVTPPHSFMGDQIAAAIPFSSTYSEREDDLSDPSAHRYWARPKDNEYSSGREVLLRRPEAQPASKVSTTRQSYQTWLMAWIRLTRTFRMSTRSKPRTNAKDQTRESQVLMNPGLLA
jgi:hypothetical protein